MAKLYETKNIVIMGENCETGVHLRRNNCFVESYPFVWANVFDKYKMLDSLDDFNAIINSEVIYRSEWGMADFIDCGCRFHTKCLPYRLMDEFGNPNEANWKLALQELRSRNAHLINKLMQLFNNPEKKLFVYKTQYLNNDNVEDYKSFLNKFVEILNRKTSNYNLLLIVTDEVYNEFKPFENEIIIVRSVKKFTPIDEADNLNKADCEGWYKIINEFFK